MNGTPLVGTFRSWRDPWGFIVCPGAFEGDLFAHREHFVGVTPPGDLTGASVQFIRGTDTKGRPNAQQIIVLRPGPRSGVVAPAAPAARALAALAALPAAARRPVAPPNVAAHFAAAVAPTVPQPARALADKLAHYVGVKLRGEIRSWKDDWGFIVCPAKFEGDLFVHRQSLRIVGDPVSGKQVSFTVAIDSRGRAAAAEVTEPAPAPEDFVGRGPLTGQVRSWKKDWGFIVVPELFEGDLFCHQESLQLDGELKEPLEQVMVGRSVTFEVAIDKKRRPCATKVIVNDLDGPRHYAPPPQGVPLLGEDLLQGTLRSWREPWGFIVSPGNFEGDLFCHKEAFVAPAPVQDLTGYLVQFRRSVDQRGRAHAREVTVLGPGPDTPAVTTAFGGKEGEAVAAASLFAWQGTVGVAPPTATAPATAATPVLTPDGMPAGGHDPKFDHLVGLQLQGQVRSWKNDWGFAVAPENFEGDLFVHKGHLEGGADHLAPGAKISFEVGIDPRGRATALHVRCLSEAKDWAGTGSRISGQIRSWKEPWGFLVSPGSFTGDLFFHVEHMGPFLRPETIFSGMEVSFKVEKDKQGRCTATEMMPVTAAPTQVKRGPLGVPMPFAGVKRARV